MAKQGSRLKKELKLFDVFAVSTGAMFSSGFFLLPGLAAAQAGPSVFLAYLLAGVLMLPAMFSQAELATAMPRAGGTYYFLDRSLGPMVGTVGGLGTYLALTLKTAFALIGIGAYAAIFIDLPIKPIAIAITVAFAVLNIMGAKETTGLQRGFVIVLLSVLAFFLVQGVFEVSALGLNNVVQEQFTPFMPFGVAGLLSTVGFVFVSYAGLTKVASVAEEVENPERNIPLGMILSLLVTSLVYVVGVFIMVSLLDPNELRADLTPVATAGAAFFDWLPQPLGLVFIVIAAIAAFASTGNAGLLSASRYPLAMARDRLVPGLFANLGRFQTPTLSIIMTAGLMIVIILFLNEEGIAKLASAFQLLIFMMLNFAVIVMRESRITSYDPGYRSPLYPWMQIAGIITANALLVYLGTQALMLTFLTVVVCLVWYFYYAHNRVMRDGALYHWFAQLGQNRYEGLDYELWQIMREKGLREEDPFDELVARATVLRVEHDFERSDITFQDLVGRVTEILGAQVPATAAELKNGFLEESRMGAMPAETGVLLPNLLLFDIQQSEMVLVHSRRGLHVDLTDVHGEHSPDNPIHAFCFLVSPEEEAKQHLRILAQIADRMDEEDFINEWLRTEDPQELKEILLRGKRFLTLRLRPDSPARILIGKELREIDMPTGNLVVMIRRNEHTIIPRGRTKLQEGDYVVIIGEPASIGEFRQRYMDQEGAQPAVRNEITVVHGANHAPPVKQLTNHVSNPASDETENESVPK